MRYPGPFVSRAEYAEDVSAMCFEQSCIKAMKLSNLSCSLPPSTSGLEIFLTPGK
jgi:hypothetical protein